MPGPNVKTAASLVPGVNAALWNTYRQTAQAEAEQLSEVMDLGMPSSLRQEIFAFRQTMPYPEVWYYGDPVPEEGTDTLPYNVTNFRYAKEISWNVDDESDNQVSSLRGDAEQVGVHMALNDTRAYFDIVNGGSDGFLPYIPIAPDGAALHNATDGATNPRFGVTGGNTATWAKATTDGMIDGIWAAFARFTRFLNTKGQPFFTSNVKTPRYVIYYSAEDAVVWEKALSQMLHQGTQAAPSNLILDTATQVRGYSTPRLPVNKAVINRTDAPRKATFSLLREAMSSVPFTPQNDGLARRLDKEGVRVKERKGYGVNIPFSSIGVTLT